MGEVVDAAKAGDTAAVERLLSDGDVDVTLDFAGRTLLYFAAEAGQAQVVKQLLAMGANPNTQDMSSRTPLFSAVQAGALSCAKLLIDAGCDVNQEDEDGRTPLSYAAQAGDAAMIQLFIDAWAQVDAEDAASRCPLSYAAESGAEAGVGALLAGGAAVNAVDSFSRTALGYACRRGHLAVAAALLEAGADSDVYDNDGKTAFSYAMGSGKMDLVKLICEKGAGVNTSEAFDSRTPLFLAVQERNLELMYVLLAYGADVNHPDKRGRSALFYAVESDVQIVTLLLMRGAAVNLKAYDGSTPLMVACARGDSLVVRALLEVGADVQAQDEAGKTAADYASNDEVRLLLEERYQRAVLYQQRYELAAEPGAGPAAGPTCQRLAAIDRETGERVMFSLYRDRTLWAATRGVLTDLTPDGRCPMLRLIGAPVVAGGDQPDSGDPWRLAAFHDPERFPEAPYVIATEMGDETVQDLSDLPAWRGQAARIQFVAARLGACLEALAGYGLVHTDLSPANVWRCFDGALRLGGGEALVRAGDALATPALQYESCPPEAARALLCCKSLVVEGSWSMWALGTVLYRLATGRRLVDDLAGDAVEGADEALALLAGLAGSELGQGRVDALVAEHVESRARVAKTRLVADLLRRLLLRVEAWQRCSVDKLLQHPLLEGSEAAIERGDGGRGVRQLNGLKLHELLLPTRLSLQGTPVYLGIAVCGVVTYLLDVLLRNRQSEACPNK